MTLTTDVYHSETLQTVLKIRIYGFIGKTQRGLALLGGIINGVLRKRWWYISACMRTQIIRLAARCARLRRRKRRRGENHAAAEWLLMALKLTGRYHHHHHHLQQQCSIITNSSSSSIWRAKPALTFIMLPWRTMACTAASPLPQQPPSPVACCSVYKPRHLMFTQRTAALLTRLDGRLGDAKPSYNALYCIAHGCHLVLRASAFCAGFAI